MTELTPANFDAIVFGEATDLVVVYFWGPDCPNCEVFKRHLPGMLPEIEKLPVKLFSANAYAHPELATRYGLHGIPTFLLVKKGRVVGKMTSFMSDEFFLTVLREKAGASS